MMMQIVQEVDVHLRKYARVLIEHSNYRNQQRLTTPQAHEMLVDK